MHPLPLYALRPMKNKSGLFFFPLFCIPLWSVFAVDLPVSNLIVQVEADAISTKNIPGQTPLQNIPGLSLRSQGHLSPQTDLSIRGAPFTSSGLLLNGLTLRNAQTEHWQGDTSLPSFWLASPLVLTGLDRFRASSGHPSGSVGLELAPLTTDCGRLAVGTGSHGLLFGELFVSQVETNEEGVLTGVSGFLSADRVSESDGYHDNPMERIQIGGRIGMLSDSLQGDLLTTFSQRTFGARGFYGTTPSYPAEEEVRNLLIAGTLQTRGDERAPSRLTAAWNRTEDTYWLDRYNPDFYENQHTTDLLALHGNTQRRCTENLSLDLRSDFDLETIESRSLGNHTRSHASLAALPNLSVGSFTFTLGGSLDLFSTDSPALLPAAGIIWAFADTQEFFLSATYATRQPSYTELNYESPTSLGNAGLDRQENRTLEVGWRGQAERLRWQTCFFQEQGRNIVDWLMIEPKSRWTAQNLDTLRTYGLAAETQFAVEDHTDLGIDVLILSKDTDLDYYASRYAMDYPEMSATLYADHRFSRALAMNLSQTLFHQADNPVREEDNWYLNTCASVRWNLPKLPSTTLHLGVDNLLDDNFQIFPGQPNAGRRIFTSLAYAW